MWLVKIMSYSLLTLSTAYTVCKLAELFLVALEDRLGHIVRFRAARVPPGYDRLRKVTKRTAITSEAVIALIKTTHF